MRLDSFILRPPLARRSGGGSVGIAYTLATNDYLVGEVPLLGATSGRLDWP
jgi:hypothetical protein